MPRKQEYTDVNDPTFVGNLNEEMRDIHRRLDTLLPREQTMEILLDGTDQTVPHQLGRKPTWWTLSFLDAVGGISWWLPARPTEKEFFIAGTTGATAIIQLRV